MNGLIDIHCHIFNATDLPIYGYLRKVIFEVYDEQRQISIDGRADGDGENLCKKDVQTGFAAWREWARKKKNEGAAEAAAALCYQIVARNNVFSAKAELTEVGNPAGDTVTARRQEDAFADAFVTFFSEGTNPAGDAPPPLEPPEVPSWREEKRKEVRRRIQMGKSPLQEWLRENAARGGFKEETNVGGDAPNPFTVKSVAKRVASSLSESDDYLSRQLRWVHTLLAKRQENAKSVSMTYAGTNQRFALYCPAIIDYSKWLETEPESDLRSQAQMMEKLSIDAKAVKFHGYMAYDPLRDVHADGEGLAIAQEAVRKMGFLGTKVYPTMGFKPLNNAGSQGLEFPAHALKMMTNDRRIVQLASALDLAKQLDTRLGEFYSWCQDEQVPILAHASASYGAGPCYERRADPALWKPVFDQFPQVRVCLGHFGDFDEALSTDGKRLDKSMLEETWEWHFATLTDAATRNVYADVSYFAEILSSSSDTNLVRDIKTSLVKLIGEHRNVPQQLIYGTDWLLLALEKNYKSHFEKTLAFMRDVYDAVDKAKTSVWLDDLCRGNGVRFLGLKGGKGGDRLAEFYKRKGRPENKDFNNEFLRRFA